MKRDIENLQEKEQIINNIEACLAILKIIRIVLGPRGMDKMIIGEGSTTILINGATIIKYRISSYKKISKFSKYQDNEIGDGTTNIMILLVNY